MKDAFPLEVALLQRSLLSGCKDVIITRRTRKALSRCVDVGRWCVDAMRGSVNKVCKKGALIGLMGVLLG